MEELISKQQAIDAINSHFGFNIEEEYGSAVQEVINGLPSAQLGTDCISRRVAINIVTFECGEWTGLAKEICKQIKQLPSAQPEIIRCKDCKQFRRWIDTDICFCDITEAEMSDSDFCSKAERWEE